MSEIKSARPHKVNGFWYLVRRVPMEFVELDKRAPVRLSTGIRIVDDPRGIRASQIVQQLDAELHGYWCDLRAGRDPRAVKSAEWARETSRRFGFEYLEGPDLRQQFGELIRRVDALTRKGPEERRSIGPALLGEVAVPKSGTKLEDLLKRYEEIVAASLMKKSPGQMKRWRTTRDTALKTFVGVVGKGKLVRELTHDDAFALRDHWNTRVLAGEVQIDSANKQIGYVAAMFREVNDFERLKMEDIFHRKIIRGGKKKQGVPFDVEHVQNVLLAPGAMDKLNPEARAIFYTVAETGLRPIEVCGLTETCIHLDGEVPFIEVTEDDPEFTRQLKNGNSVRDVPLVGVALEAMRAFPKGFPTYRDKADALSAAVNKHLTKNELLQNPKQSFYSLRHTFKDRLRDAKIEDEMKDMLMGHATGKEAYGRGYLLKAKHEVLLRIAFKAPAVSFERQAGVRGPGRHRLGGGREPPRLRGRPSAEPLDQQSSRQL